MENSGKEDSCFTLEDFNGKECHNNVQAEAEILVYVESVNKEGSLSIKIYDQFMEKYFHFGNESCKWKKSPNQVYLHLEIHFEEGNSEMNFQPILAIVHMLKNDFPLEEEEITFRFLSSLELQEFLQIGSIVESSMICNLN